MNVGRLIALIAIVFLSTIAQASVLDGIDAYGSKYVTAESIVAHASSDIEAFAVARMANDSRAAAKAETQAIKKIAELGRFAFIKLSLIRYSAPKPGDYLTVDLVDEEDAQKRLRFLPPPTGTVTDSLGLLTEWDKYQTLAVELDKAGEQKYPFQCPAFHCTYGFGHPELKRFGEWFSSKVPEQTEELFRLFHEDKDDHKRANAAFLLAHTGDGHRLVRELSQRISDPSAEARNNVMRVLANVGFAHPEITLPTEKIIEALNSPTTTDRNKALAVLSSIAKKEDQKQIIIKLAGPILIETLKLKQPNNHDWAYATLVNLSGQQFGERDYEAWSNWLETEINR